MLDFIKFLIKAALFSVAFLLILAILSITGLISILL